MPMRSWHDEITFDGGEATPRILEKPFSDRYPVCVASRSVLSVISAQGIPLSFDTPESHAHQKRVFPGFLTLASVVATSKDEMTESGRDPDQGVTQVFISIPHEKPWKATDALDVVREIL